MDQDCAICLAKLNPAKKDISATQCGHLFHSDCIKRAIRVKSECPICKTIISGGIVNKLYVEVDEGLVYDGCCSEIEEKIEGIKECEKKTERKWLNIIRDLEKKNKKLNEDKIKLISKNASLEKELASADWCIESYKEEYIYIQEKCRNLESDKSNLKAGLKKKNQELLEVEKEALGLVATIKRKIGEKRYNEENENKGLFLTCCEIL